MNLEAALRDQVKAAVGKVAPEAPVLKLKGDASNRSYYRVGSGAGSYVLMVMPPDSLKKSEEATAGDAPTELPFLNVHRYLSGLGIRVPRIHRFDEPAGMMVLEDLGDLTFEQALEGGQRWQEYYPRAVQLLAQLRVQAERRPDPSCLAFGRAFDVPLYHWELHHFREWGLEAWSGSKASPSEAAQLETHFQHISNALAAEPKGFTHRDYQSRNLMVKDGELVVIDFQDALLGPRQYDLVALLRDSYVELPRDFVEAMVVRYLEAYQKAGGERLDRTGFMQTFDLLTVQRKLKDAGRFEYINRVKGNPGFLVSIPASLRYVRDALERRPELLPMRRILARYVPELS
jgi:aminoglycoside/choline kinase family phosphotransferase